jgi:hypothetical protein
MLPTADVITGLPHCYPCYYYRIILLPWENMRNCNNVNDQNPYIVPVIVANLFITSQSVRIDAYYTIMITKFMRLHFYGIITEK